MTSLVFMADKGPRLPLQPVICLPTFIFTISNAIKMLIKERIFEINNKNILKQNHWFTFIGIALNKDENTFYY